MSGSRSFRDADVPATSMDRSAGGGAWLEGSMERPYARERLRGTCHSPMPSNSQEGICVCLLKPAAPLRGFGRPVEVVISVQIRSTPEHAAHSRAAGWRFRGTALVLVVGRDRAVDFIGNSAEVVLL
jgi:hypothetical protein